MLSFIKIFFIVYHLFFSYLRTLFLNKYFTRFIKKSTPQALHNSKAQIIIEYILLLVVATMIALLLINLVSVDSERGSPIFKYWKHLLETVAEDIST